MYEIGKNLYIKDSKRSKNRSIHAKFKKISRRIPIGTKNKEKT